MGWLMASTSLFGLSRFSQARNTSSVSSPPPQQDVPQKPKQDIGIRKLTTLTALQKWALVFSGKYKTQADIPEMVPIEVLERARSRARIKVSNILMGFTLIGCLAYAYSGRKAAERGESVSQMNLDWHKEYAEKRRQENAETVKK